MNTTFREWDAGSYHRISGPQFTWGMRVLERLKLAGDETICDVGCGTGRLTAALLERLPRGRVIAVDRSANMVAEARAALAPDAMPAHPRVLIVQADATALPLEGSIDGIFSTATFHWVLDAPALYRCLIRVLKPGGWLDAQCGGGPNLARLRSRARDLMMTPRFAEHFVAWSEPTLYLDPDIVARHMRDAGFVDVRTNTYEEPTPFSSAAEYRTFIERVCLRHHLARLPDEALRNAYLDALVEQAAHDDPAYLLDYWRLDLHGRRP